MRAVLWAAGWTLVELRGPWLRPNGGRWMSWNPQREKAAGSAWWEAL